MALRSGYKGFKKLLPGLKIIRPGTLGIDNDILIPELNKTFFPRSEQAVLGAKNLCPNNATTKTDGGVTFTVNSDGSVTLNGTANATVGFELKTYGRWLKAGVRYVLNGCTGGSDSTYKLSVNSNTGDFAKCLDGDVEFTVDNTFDYRVWIVAFSGTQFNNLTIYPMIRLASDPDSTYVPYAMTNRELTENKADKVVRELTSSDDLDTITEYGTYVIKTLPTHAPESADYCTLLVTPSSTIGTGAVIQTVIRYDRIYTRRRSSGTWSSWYKFTGTALS